MSSTKQSNWILGFGVFVAIVLIISSIWLQRSPVEQQNSVDRKEIPELGQTIRKVNEGINWFSAVIIRLI